MNNTQAHELIRLLWPHLKTVKGFKNRRMTAWGSKTQLGLVLSIEAAYSGMEHPKVSYQEMLEETWKDVDFK